MTSGNDHRRGSRGASCDECGAPFAGDQRYCIQCGARRGELPAAVAAQIAPLRDRDRGVKAAAGAVSATAVAAAAATAKAAAKPSSNPLTRWIPSPRGAAGLVMGMLALGVVIGSATSQIAESAGLQTIILEVAEKKAAPPEPVVAAAPEPEVEAPAEEAPIPVEASSLPEVPEEIVEEPLPEEPVEEPAPLELPPELAEEELLPEVKHVFLVVLGENGFEQSFAPTSTAPYLAKTLPEQGELLTNYFAVAQGKLANQAALLSGQGPTPQLTAECPLPLPPPTEPGALPAPAPLPPDILPGTLSPEGQVEGDGCVYPAPVETLPGQLAAQKLKWKAYVEEAVPGTPEAPGCPRPFALFHSLLDSPECVASDAGLPQLATDLKVAKKTPTLSYIVPNACHAGAVEPCEPGGPTGPVAAEAFLKTVVPEIVNSPAYAEGGLLLITSAQAPQTGAAADPSSCCATPAYPNLPALPEEPPTGPVKGSGGGGQVGLLLLSSFVAPGTVNETTYANHFTLLLTIEELLGLEKLGYAAEPAQVPFDNSVFNAASVAAEEEESTSVSEEKKKGSKVKPRLALGWSLGLAAPTR